MTRITLRLAALLICVGLMISLCACKSRNEKEQEAFEDIARLMLIHGTELAQDIYAVGLNAETPDSVELDYKNGSYYPVQSEKYTSIAQIKSATEEFFTAALAQQWLYADAFDSQPPLYKEDGGVLYVNIACDNSDVFSAEWLMDTFKVITFDDEKASVSVEMISSDQPYIVEVGFERTAVGWRISTALYGDGAAKSTVSYTDAQQLAAAQYAVSGSNLLG